MDFQLPSLTQTSNPLSARVQPPQFHVCRFSNTRPSQTATHLTAVRPAGACTKTMFCASVTKDTPAPSCSKVDFFHSQPDPLSSKRPDPSRRCYSKNTLCGTFARDRGHMNKNTSFYSHSPFNKLASRGVFLLVFYL